MILILDFFCKIVILMMFAHSCQNPFSS